MCYYVTLFCCQYHRQKNVYLDVFLADFSIEISVQIFRLHRMHDMLTIVIVVCALCLSVCLSVTRLKLAVARAVYAVFHAWGHLVQPLSNYFDHLFTVAQDGVAA